MATDNCPPVGTWLRHLKTGDLGQVIEKEGKKWIKPDIPGSPVLYPGTTHYNWQVEPHARRLPPGSYARVAYEANKALCEIHPELKRQKDWLSLSANDKAMWIEGRVKFDKPLQVYLYDTILKILEEKSE